MIYFSELKYKNFLSTGNNFTTISLTGNTTTLIVGKNGSGKSTILDAITFVLFGKPFRKINKPQLLNTTNDSDCIVEITFTINKKEYQIRRGIKPNVFEIFENGKLLQQDAAIKDYQQHLEENILRMTYKAFCQIVVIGNATYQPFMKLNPAERRQIVENFLDIDVFTKMNVLLKSKITETKEQINGASYQADLAKEKLRMAKTLLSSSEENIDGKIQENEQALEAKREAIEEQNQKMAVITSEIQEIIVQEETISKLNKKIREMDGLQTTLETKFKGVNKEIQFLNANDNCPTCKQEIDSEFKESSLSEKAQKVAEYKKAISELTNHIENHKKELDSHMRSMEEIDRRNKQIEKIQLDLNYIRKDILRIQEENKKLLKEKQQNIQKNREEYDALSMEFQKLTDERDSLLERQHGHSIAALLLKDDGIKTKIIRYYLPAMNKLINKYLHALEFYINWNLDENFNEVIKQANKESFTYASFSEGEKLRIDLAILFAWREIAKAKNSTNCNILMLDEIFDSSLDGAGIDDFIGIINTVSENTNVFIISHRGDQVADKFSNTIKFAKLNGFSKIV
jgi:DNA repair exonuclease SbcCD ATPase subunit